MLARSQLADHNHYIDRQQVKGSNGTRWSVFPKATKAWVAKPIAQPKTYDYLQEMVNSVIQRRSMET